MNTGASPPGASSSPAWLEGTRGPFRDLVDYILGITHEIWESRQVERIHDYYSADCVIYTLGGIIRGAETVVRNTWDTLGAFPDRLLLGDDVIWSREGPGHFYSSHRITSPMTNRGPSAFGPATGRAVLVRTIADCVVENGVITREWLVRDNYGLVRQLGFDPLVVARAQAAVAPAAEHAAWLRSERDRVRGGAPATVGGAPVAWSEAEALRFAEDVLRNAWLHGAAPAFAAHYAPYAVLHDSAPVASGLPAIREACAAQRRAFGAGALAVDHVCVRPLDADGWRVAARWTLAARHVGDAWGVAATQREVLLLGVTHWQIVAGRIAAEWTIFDRIAVLAQLLR
jgi:predicted ester cyclase